MMSLLMILAGAGAVAGFLAGLFGIGGGVILVPALYHVFVANGVAPDMATRLALGTSLAIILPTGFSSAFSHYKRDSVSREAFLRLLPGVVAGALFGSVLASHLNGVWLRGGFAFFLLGIAALMLKGKKGIALVQTLPTGLAAGSLGGGIGFVSALMGLGGGTLTVSTLAGCGFSLRVAVGTGAALGIAIALPGALGFVFSGWGVGGLPEGALGYVSLPAVLVVAPVSAFLAPVGAAAAHRLPPLWHQRVFALVLAGLALKMLATLPPG